VKAAGEEAEGERGEEEHPYPDGPVRGAVERRVAAAKLALAG